MLRGRTSIVKCGYSRCSLQCAVVAARSRARTYCQASSNTIKEATLGQTPNEYKSIARNDLTTGVAINSQDVAQVSIKVPRFGPEFSISYPQQKAPVLSPVQIQRIKAAAIGTQSANFKNELSKIQTVDSTSRFIHPGTTASPAELALLKVSMKRGQATSSNAAALPTTVQEAAHDRLVTGNNITPKPWGKYTLPQPTPAVITPFQQGSNDTSYHGPYAMEKVCILYSGKDAKRTAQPGKKSDFQLAKEAREEVSDNMDYKPGHYPPGAPQDNIGHMCFVEFDSQMAIRQAMAYWGEADPARANQHAQNAFRIIDAWVKTNRGWHPNGYDRRQNGPLEAGWGIACMAQALELLRNVKPDSNIGLWKDLKDRFVKWVNDYGMKQINFYLYTMVPNLTNKGFIDAYNNWTSTMAEAKMAVAILADDRKLYDEAKQIYDKTVKDYVYKWGRQLGDVRFQNRDVGETSETLRDIYHAQFGLGGLLNCAEMAWQQNDDLYSAPNNEYALVSAMELHARIILAGFYNSPQMLPASYVLPNTGNGVKLPANLPRDDYSWIGDRQAWVNKKNKSELRDGKKYLSGVKFLPTGWEIGFNHYAGRLGIPMYETAALLKLFWPEWQEWSWGSGTLTHAGTAAQLWTPGLTEFTKMKPKVVVT